MSVEAVGIIGGLALTAIGMLSAGVYQLWRDRNAAQERAIEKARGEALAMARSEALIREANAALAAKNTELAAVKGQLTSCEQARSELRQMLLRCTGGLT